MTKTISPGNNRLRDFALDLANRKAQALGRGRAVLEVVAVLGLISLSGRAMVEKSVKTTVAKRPQPQ